MVTRGIVVTDPIADMLTRIRNSLERSQAQTTLPASNLTIELARILKEEGYLRDYRVEAEEGPRRTLVLQLKYKGKRGRERAITGLERVSTPGRRVYVTVDEIPRVLNGLGVAVLTTSQGLMADHEARRRNIGGELLCKVW
jgi:small subunit ribosomal protein S8